MHERRVETDREGLSWEDRVRQHLVSDCAVCQRPVLSQNGVEAQCPTGEWCFVCNECRAIYAPRS